jgi:hypothetical protein
LKGDQYIGIYGNRIGDNILKNNARLLLTKRFYLVDVQKNTKINEEKQQFLIRVPKKISLHIHFEVFLIKKKKYKICIFIYFLIIYN